MTYSESEQTDRAPGELTTKSSRRSRWAALFSAVFVAHVALSPRADAQGIPDCWSSPIDLIDAAGSGPGGGPYLAPVHASLMPDGSVVLFAWRQTDPTVVAPQQRLYSSTAIIQPDQLIPSPAQPTTLSLQTFAEPVVYNTVNPGPPASFRLDTLFCSGHALQADGNLFVAGGLRKMNFTSDGATYALGGGVPYVSTWDYRLQAWEVSSPVMAGTGSAGLAVPPYFVGPERYYPTATRLPDGRMLIISGSQILEGSFTIGAETTVFSNDKNLSVETYDPSSETFSVLSHDPTSLQLPMTPYEIFNGDYTHAYTLPNPVAVGPDVFDVLMIGQSGDPVLMSTSGATRWSALGPKRPAGQQDPNHGAAALLLPMRLAGSSFGYSNGSVLVAGGGESGAHLDQFDVYDPTTQQWTLSGQLSIERHHPSTVLLPDGKILVVAGFDEPGGTSIELRQAEYIDPRNKFAVQNGTANSYTVRGYHTITLLLPDGRVLVGGGRVSSINPAPSGILERADFEFLEPPYCSQLRPTILSAPSTIRYGQPFFVNADASKREVVLISLGSMTHSADMNQRYVQLGLITGRASGSPTAPGGSDSPDPPPARLATPAQLAGGALGGSGAPQTPFAPLSERFGLRPFGNVMAPPNAALAPPGYYMLFVLDNSLVPSEAKIVRLF